MELQQILEERGSLQHAARGPAAERAVQALVAALRGARMALADAAQVDAAATFPELQERLGELQVTLDEWLEQFGAMPRPTPTRSRHSSETTSDAGADKLTAAGAIRLVERSVMLAVAAARRAADVLGRHDRRATFLLEQCEQAIELRVHLLRGLDPDAAPGAA